MNVNTIGKRSQVSPLLLSLIGLVGLAAVPHALALSTEGDTTPIVAAPLPPPAAGRTVIADPRTSASLILAVDESKRRKQTMEAEDWDVIAQINRAPSTYQTYLLYTQEDLPDRLFNPGFTIVLGRSREQRAAKAGAPGEAPEATAKPPEN